MKAVGRLLDEFSRSGRRPLRVLAASGQLGYGIPTPAFVEGLSRQPDFIGCDMGSIDIGPYYLGSGKFATSPAATRRDLAKVLTAARKLNIPLIIGSAGSAGARPHLEATLSIVREIARSEGLEMRLGVLRADISPAQLKRAIHHSEVRAIDGMPELTEQEVDAAAQIVAQMGSSSFEIALAQDVDVLIAGRSCDTAIFAALPIMLGFAPALALHMAKIIECASICCVPGGRDSILATLEDDGFVLESMAKQRRATPTSVAAHSLYEQSDPLTVLEPEGRLDLSQAHYTEVDERRTRVTGAIWEPTADPWVKIEGARNIGERAILICGSADPRFIARHREILREVESIVRDLVCEGQPLDYSLYWRVYGVDGVRASADALADLPREVFILGECIAPTADRASEVVKTAKQYLLHHGYPGRLSTGGNLAFPFTPPEVSVGPAYRFNIYHLMRATNLQELFGLEVEDL